MASFAELLPAHEGATVLRKLRTSDLERFHAYRSSEELGRYQGWEAMSWEQSLGFLERASVVQGLMAGAWIQLGIAERTSDELIGDVGIFLNQDGSEGEVGFTLRQESHGRGHATRAVLLAAELIFASTRIQALWAVSDARNTPSLAVLRRCGFTFVRARQAVFKGEPCTEKVFVRRRDSA